MTFRRHPRHPLHLRCFFTWIGIEWKRKDGVFRWDVTVPVNATATVYVPAKAVGGVIESGKAALDARGVRFVRCEGNRAVLEVGSGGYSFRSRE